MNPLFFCEFKQLRNEFNLSKGLAARYRNTALLHEGAVAERISENVRGFPFFSLSEFPGIRIVAVETAHGTALQEYDITDAGAVHCTERFRRVNITLHDTTPYSC